MVNSAEKVIHITGRTAFVLAVLVLLLAIGHGGYTVKQLSQRELDLKKMCDDIGEAMDSNPPPDIEREEFMASIKGEWQKKVRPLVLNPQVFYKK